MSAARWVSIVAVLLPTCSTPAGIAEQPGDWRYEVTVEQGGAELRVAAVFPPGEELRLAVDLTALRFVDEVRAESGEIRIADGVWRLPRSDRARPMQWRFRALDAARALDNRGVAAWHGNGYVGSLSGFLLRDEGAADGVRMVLRARSTDGSSFACACARSGDAWTLPGEDLSARPPCAFGAISVARRSGAFELTVVRMDPPEDARSAAIVEWASELAAEIERFFGRFPVDRLLVIVSPNRRLGIADGLTRGWGGATISVSVNARVDAARFRRDWVLTHEMIHLALPSLPREQSWLEEGSAVYLEPLLRARAGWVTEEEVWAEFLDHYSQGLPTPGDTGLDHDRSWGRTYYGGAIFCLLADVRIRERTENRKSLRDAFAGIVAAGENITHDGSIERVIELGDRATGTTVLSELYAAMKDSAEPRELQTTWKRLGVRQSGGRVDFDDAAPLARVRRALILGRH